MASKIDVFNMALAHVGISSTVADESERSPERFACSRFWDTCRDALFAYKDMRWRFATARVKLADIGDPPLGWGYRYRYPNDCINALSITSDSGRAVLNEYAPKFTIEWEEGGRVILSDTESAELIYIRRIEEVERWPSTFVEAVAYRLAAQIAMPLRNDSGVRAELIQLAEQFAQIAMAASLNEEQPDNPVPSLYERELHA